MNKNTFEKVVEIQTKLQRYQNVIKMVNHHLNNSKETANLLIKKDEMVDIVTLFASKIKELETDIEKL